MMLPFQTRKPRRFHHEPIYSDERSERLARVEQRAREALGMPCGEETAHRSRSISFATPRQQSHRLRRGLRLSVPAMLVLLLVLIVLLLLAML